MWRSPPTAASGKCRYDPTVMTKWLLFLLIAYLAWRLLRGRKEPPASPPPPSSPEAVVGCAWCGLHVPLSESLEAAGRRYCSEEHRSLGSADSRD